MSSDDADDERDTPAVTPVQWIDSRHQSFTIFVVLPSEEVCTLRDLPSGITAFDLKVNKVKIVYLSLTQDFNHRSNIQINIKYKKKKKVYTELKKKDYMYHEIQNKQQI